jgi:hypothetical protein
MTWNTAIDATRAAAAGYLRVRYEDLVSDPESELNRILDFLGLTTRTVPNAQGRQMWLEPQHTVAGNPSRFVTGHAAIQLDDAWIREMPTAAKCAVTAITAPMLLRYGYSLTK